MCLTVPAESAAVSSRIVSRVERPCPARHALSKQHRQPLDSSWTANARRCASTLLLSTSFACVQLLTPVQTTATIVDAQQAQSRSSTASNTSPSTAFLRSVPSPILTPPTLLASTLTSTADIGTGGASGAVVAAVEEAEELAMDVVHFFQHGLESVGSAVHHLQVVHTLERLQDMPLNEVVDLQLLKTALHTTPVTDSTTELYGVEYDQGEAVYDNNISSSSVGRLSSSEAAAIRDVDAALDEVSEWRLREVVDVGKLATALQDVPYSGPLESRSMVAAAPRIRRTVHWESVADAVRPKALRQALSALGGSARNDSPFASLDVRAAVGAVRMDLVRQVLSPRPDAVPPHSHTLDSSGLWTWESS